MDFISFVSYIPLYIYKSQGICKLGQVTKAFFELFSLHLKMAGILHTSLTLFRITDRMIFTGK